MENRCLLYQPLSSNLVEQSVALESECVRLFPSHCLVTRSMRESEREGCNLRL